MLKILLPTLLISAILLGGCTSKQPVDVQEPKAQPNQQEVNIAKVMKIISKAFEDNQQIPKKYTCDGDNINPPLLISEIPENTKSLVLIVDDPDAPAKTWVHWLVYNIPPQFGDIREGSLPPNSQYGINDFGNDKYGGPCPPPGPEHRYFFKAYALDNILEIPKSANKADIEQAMEGHILTQDQLIGVYKR